jgi:DNA modification methylase
MFDGTTALDCIINGDCLEVMKTIPDGTVDMILCDLPYGTTQCKWDSIIPFEPLWSQYLRVAKPNAAIVLFAAQPFTSALIMSQPKLFKYDWTWKKTGRPTGHLNAKKMPLRDKEDIAVFYRQHPTYNPQMSEGEPYKAKIPSGEHQSTYGVHGRHRNDNHGVRYPKQVLEFKNVPGPHVVHPTQKPVDLCRYLIRTYSNPGEVVLDNCIGSGTTAIAAMREGRRFIGIEREQKYAEIAMKRIQEESQR